MERKNREAFTFTFTLICHPGKTHNHRSRGDTSWRAQTAQKHTQRQTQGGGGPGGVKERREQGWPTHSQKAASVPVSVKWNCTYCIGRSVRREIASEIDMKFVLVISCIGASTAWSVGLLFRPKYSRAGVMSMGPILHGSDQVCIGVNTPGAFYSLKLLHNRLTAAAAPPAAALVNSRARRS